MHAEADAAALALDRAQRRVEAIADPAERDAAMEEITEARDVLGVARSGALSSARIGDDGTLDEIEAVVADLHRWADAFPRPRPPRTPSSGSGAPGTPRRP